MEKQKQEIQNICYINKYDSFNVIAYLVSKIEGMHYSIAETDIVLYATAFYGSVSYPSPVIYKLAYYKGKDRDNIRYKYENNIWIWISKSSSYNIDSAIYDKRYTYIIEFMNEVINYRLNKEDFIICYDEMIELADDFVKRYKSNKSLVLAKK